MIRFKVAGRGHFPVDMLRYDECFPFNGQAVTAIEHFVRYPSAGAGEPSREVELVTMSRQPTDARWLSFGWSVLRTEYGALL